MLVEVPRQRLAPPLMIGVGWVRTGTRKFGVNTAGQTINSNADTSAILALSEKKKLSLGGGARRRQAADEQLTTQQLGGELTAIH